MSKKKEKPKFKRLCKSCHKYFLTNQAQREHCYDCSPAKNKQDKVDEELAKMDENLESAFMKTMERQRMQDKIRENKDKITKLGRIINQSPEMKEIKQLGKQNQSLGQHVRKVQNRIDKIIIDAESEFRDKRMKELNKKGGNKE